MMRLIDADAYSAKMKKLQDACEKLMHDAERWNDVGLMGRADSAFSVFAEAKLTLDKMPTVDAVKHGKWQWISSTYDRTPCEMKFRCSICHHEVIRHNAEPWEHYCPQCGAKMDGEKKEDG